MFDSDGIELPGKEPLSNTQSDPMQAGYDAGLRALAGREHSMLELRRKLFQKGHDAAVIDAVLARLADDGSLSEERFVESFVRSRLSRGDGPIKIRLGLSQRGIPDRLASDAISACGEIWYQRAVGLVHRKFGFELAELEGCQVDLADWQDADPDSDSRDQAERLERLRQRASRHLNSKGYPSDVIVEVIEALPRLGD